MTRQRVVLHIGWHRTASTSLQTWLWLNRPWLRALGVCYPAPRDRRGFRGPKHGDLRLAALAEGRAGATGRMAPLLAAYADAIRATRAPLTVLSCEGFSARENHFAPRLAPLAEAFDVTVLAFVRRPDHWLESFYRHRMRLLDHAETRTFPVFAAAPQQRDYVTGRAEMMGWWAQAFGADALRLIPYCPAEPGFDPVAAFVDAADLPRAAHLLPWRLHRNPGFSREQAEAVRRARLAGAPITRAGLARLRRRMGPGTRAYLGDVRRAALLAEAAPDLAALAQMSGRATLFPSPPEPPPNLVEDWDAERWQGAPDPNTWCFPP